MKNTILGYYIAVLEKTELLQQKGIKHYE